MMSFSDVDYDEVRDERESRTFRLIKNILKWSVYGLSALVWVLILITVFSTRDSKIYDRMMFTEATEQVAEQTDDYRVHQIYIADYMTDKENTKMVALSASNCYYAAETGELSVGIKYNKSLTGSDETDSIRYVLTDQDGNEYPAVVMDEDVIGRFGYARICFTGLSLPLEVQNDRSTQTGDGKFVLTLTLYRVKDGAFLSTYTKKDGEEIVEVNDSAFIVFDANTSSRMADYED